MRALQRWVVLILFIVCSLSARAIAPDRDCCERRRVRDIPIDMLPFMVFDQGPEGNIHLEGNFVRYGEDGSILHVSRDVFGKGYHLAETTPEGFVQYVYLKAPQGWPIEHYSLHGQYLVSDYEEMDWVNNAEWREFKNLAGEPTFEIARKRVVAEQFVLQGFAGVGGFTYYYCGIHASNYYQPTGPSGYVPHRIFDLSVESADEISAELNEVDAVDPAWKDFGRALGYPDAHVLLLVVDGYWAGIAPRPVSLREWGNDALWANRERYKFMALQLPDGTVKGIGEVAWAWWVHENSNDPIRKYIDVRFNRIILEADPVIHAMEPCKTSN